MLNDTKKIAKEFNIPAYVLADWRKTRSFKGELVERLDIYYELHKKAHNKILSLFNKEELIELLGAIFESDFFPFIEILAGLNLKEGLKEVIIDSKGGNDVKFKVLTKVRELCEFEIYTLLVNFGKAYNKACKNREAYSSKYFNGRIDQVRIFKHVLTDEEVAKLYNEQPNFKDVIKSFRELYK